MHVMPSVCTQDGILTILNVVILKVTGDSMPNTYLLFSIYPILLSSWQLWFSANGFPTTLHDILSRLLVNGKLFFNFPEFSLQFFTVNTFFYL